YAWNAFIPPVRRVLADLVRAVTGDWQLPGIERACESTGDVPVHRAWTPALRAGLADRGARHKKIQADYISRGHDLHFVQLPVALYKLTQAINSKLLVFQLRSLMRQHGISCFDTIIISNPMFFARDVLSHVKTKQIIYACSERYEYAEHQDRDV